MKMTTAQLAKALHTAACRKDHNDGRCGFTFGTPFDVKTWTDKAQAVQVIGVSDADAIALAKVFTR